MKQMKFFALVLTFLMGVSLTSCFDSGSSNSYDGTAFVTVYQSYLSNGVVLKTDDGYTLTPTNPSALLLSDGKSYPERALVYYKFAEGEKFVQGKTSYNVSVEGGMGIEVKSFNNKPDTIKNDYNIIAMDLWHANGYVTVASNFYYGGTVGFDFIQQKVGNDTLYVKFNYSKGGNAGYNNSGTTYVSLKLPSYIEDIQPKNDSIWVKVSAKGPNDETLVKNVRCKYDLY